MFKRSRVRPGIEFTAEELSDFSWLRIEMLDESAAVRGGGRARDTAGCGTAGAVTVPSVPPEQQQVLDRVDKLIAALEAGERAGASLTQREAESELQGQRREMQM